MYQRILNWSEVWATLIPLTAFLFQKKKEKCLKVVGAYLIFAFIVYAFGDLIRLFHFQLKGFLQYNNWLYNIHSVVRTLSFILFFECLNIRPKRLNPKLTISTLLAVSLVIFLFVDDFFIISSKVFTIEGIVLLIYCVSFFLDRIKDEQVYLDFDGPLVVVTGLTIYESVNFFIFLFFNLLMEDAVAFADAIWDVHNWAYIIFCLFITYAFYGRTRFVYS